MFSSGNADSQVLHRIYAYSNCYALRLSCRRTTASFLFCSLYFADLPTHACSEASLIIVMKASTQCVLPSSLGPVARLVEDAHHLLEPQEVVVVESAQQGRVQIEHPHHTLGPIQTQGQHDLRLGLAIARCSQPLIGP